MLILSSDEKKDAIVLRHGCGDIGFFVLKNDPRFVKPYRYYDIMGIPSDSDINLIKRVYRRPAGKLHNDKIGVEGNYFNVISGIAGILLDDGGSLGVVHSLRYMTKTSWIQRPSLDIAVQSGTINLICDQTITKVVKEYYL